MIGSKKSKKWQVGKGWGNIVKWFSYERKQSKENKIMIQLEFNFIGSRTIRLFVKHFFRRNFLFRSIFFCVSIQKKQKQKCTLRFLSQKNCTFFWKRLRNKNRAAAARKCNCLDLTFEQIRVETDCSNSFGVTFM